MRKPRPQSPLCSRREHQHAATPLTSLTARFQAPTSLADTHMALDQDLVTGDLKGSSSMTVLFLRSSGVGFTGAGTESQMISR